MHEHIKSTCYVVCNNEAIWAVGATPDQAWADFISRLDPGTEERPDDSAYKIRPATAALMALVEERGGDVAWETARGILCTVEEFETKYHAEDRTSCPPVTTVVKKERK